MINHKPRRGDYQAEPDVAPKGLPITDVRFYGTPKGNFLTYVSAVVAGSVALKHMRLVISKRAGERVLLTMPCRQDGDGAWKEIYHPIRRDVRRQLELVIIGAYTAKQNNNGEDESGDAGQAES